MSTFSPSKRDIADFHRHLNRWYAAHGRKSLPWRNTGDPYAIYVSEIMLQQTQVKTVLERYYFQFLKRFPTLAALAAANQKTVLTAWQGLGYYNRALNLHKAAKLSNGALPQTVEGLHALPGIGRNTAHAVAAFAFRQPVAVMEANVKRVLSRIFALKNPSAEILWEKAALLLNKKEPFDYNQAMMDIGAMVCTKRAPDCPHCPANNICKGQNSPESYPAPAVKKAPPVRKKTIVILCNAHEKYYAVPRATRFLNGLYHFIEIDREDKKYPLAQMKKLGSIRQQYSHFTLEADVYLADGKTSKGKGWHSLSQLQKLPFSMAEKKILVILSEAEGSYSER